MPFHFKDLLWKMRVVLVQLSLFVSLVNTEDNATNYIVLSKIVLGHLFKHVMVPSNLFEFCLLKDCCSKTNNPKNLKCCIFCSGSVIDLLHSIFLTQLTPWYPPHITRWKQGHSSFRSLARHGQGVDGESNCWTNPKVSTGHSHPGAGPVPVSFSMVSLFSNPALSNLNRWGNRFAHYAAVAYF